MKDWERRLYVLTRDPFYLGAICIVILVIGLIGAGIAGFIRPLEVPKPRPTSNVSLPESTPFRSKLDWMGMGLNHPDFSFAEKLSYVRLATESIPRETYPDAAFILENSPLSDLEKNWAELLIQSLLLNDKTPTDRLFDEAQSRPPLRYAALVMGHVYRAAGQRQTAAEWFEKEGRAFSEASHSRKLALQEYSDTGQFSKVQLLLDEPEFKQVSSPYFMLDLAGKQHQWSRVFQLLIQTQLRYENATYIALALISMLIWFIFCIQAGQIKSLATLSFWLCIIAIPAGVFSTILTLFCAVYQEHIWGLVEQSSAIGGITYYVIGVGLREEVTKLIMFSPFVPILLKRGNDLEMLIVAACVGLGFAAEENIQYFQNGGAISAPTRFMTANFLHLALTGLAGLSFCRIFRNPKTGIVDFIAMFTAVVLLHGLYNSFQAVPALTDLVIFTWTTFVGIGYLFFHELRKSRLVKRETFSLRATFLFGLSFLVSLALILISAQMGFSMAIQIVIPAMLQMLLIVYMFIRELSGT